MLNIKDGILLLALVQDAMKIVSMMNTFKVMPG